MTTYDPLYDRMATKEALRRALAEARGVPMPVFDVSESLFNKFRKAFVEEYERCTGLIYRFSARDGKSLQSIIDQIRAMPTLVDKSDNSVFNCFYALIANLPEWYKDNQFNLPVIDHKFNDIVTSIKNGKNGNGKNNGISDEYKQKLAFDLYA